MTAFNSVRGAFAPVSGCVLAVSLWLTMGPEPVSAATFFVTPAGNDAANGSSWVTAKQTVTAGILAARPGDQVWVAAGTYEERITLRNNVGLYGGFAGGEDPGTFNLDDRDLAANATILDGNFGGTVVTVPTGATTNCRIDGFTITHGRANRGGGVYMTSASPTIAHCRITNNVALLQGGAFFVDHSAAVVANTTITSNSAVLDGGGVFLSYSTATLVNCTIADNTARVGGGVYLFEASPLIANTIIAFNSSGVYGTGTPTLRSNCVSGNSSYDYLGVPDPTGIDGNIKVDPRFADLQYGNYHIQPDSPCRDAGSNADVNGSTDVDGQPRLHPAGGTVDIGADETDGTDWPIGPYAVVRVSPLGDDAHDGSTWALAKRSVQAGIDAAAAVGGEVWVQAGTYFERITLHPHAYVYGGFAGNELVRDARNWAANRTTLDGQQQGSVVTVQAGQHTSALDGFTITHGDANLGGGIFIASASPLINHNLIRANTASRGGGLFLGNASPMIANSLISDNNTSLEGAGLCLTASSSPTIVNATIATNSGAGALYLEDSSPTVVNTIVVFNSSGVRRFSGTPTLRYNCVYGNAGSDYVGIANPTGVDGNISVDPRLADLTYGNHHLQPDSPCVDAGNNADTYGDTDIDAQPRPQPGGGTADIGADESDGIVWAPGPYAIVHVSPVGDDAHDGASWAQAKQTVQAGIDVASAVGGEVWVQSGTYFEQIALHPYAYTFGGFAGDELDRDARNWTTNLTVLDGQQQGSVVTVWTGTHVSTLDGFTITHGDGVSVRRASPTITHNTIVANSGTGLALAYSPAVTTAIVAYNTIRDNEGSGVYSRAGAAPLVTDNLITNNGSTGIVMLGNGTIRRNMIVGNGAAGISVDGAAPLIASNRITGNSGSGVEISEGGYLIANNVISDNHGGMVVSHSAVRLVSNTIAGNSAGIHGAALYLENASALIADTIIAFNSYGITATAGIGGGIAVTFRHNCIFDNGAIPYSGVTDPTGTNGNISANPLFVDAAGGDYHLATGSPCIDAGENAGVPADVFDLDGDGNTSEPLPWDLDGLPRFVDDPDTLDCPWGGDCGTAPLVDMGAYEFQPAAPPACLGDVNCDGSVTFADIDPFVARLGCPDNNPACGTGCPWQNADINGDGAVTFTDINPFVAQLGTTCP